MPDVSTSLVSFLLSKESITDIIVDRIESDALSQGVSVPAIVYRRISTAHGSTLQGSKAGVVWTRFEVDSIAPTRLQADQLAEAIRLCGILDLKRTTVEGLVIQGVIVDSGIRHSIDPPEQGDHQRRYVSTQDYQISFNEAV